MNRPLTPHERMLGTMVPSLILASFIGLSGWIEVPRSPWMSTILALYFIWLWVDWVVNRK